MKFTRDAVYTYTSTGPTSYTQTLVYPEITDLVFSGPVSDPNGAWVAVYDVPDLWETTFEYDNHGWDQIFVYIHILNLGATLSHFSCRIDFENPDVPGSWTGSHAPECRLFGGVEYPLRTDDIRQWTLTQTGSFIVSSRIECRHFKRWRANFYCGKAEAADADTLIRCYWSHDGGHGAEF
jgi:hypothetical protein